MSLILFYYFLHKIQVSTLNYESFPSLDLLEILTQHIEMCQKATFKVSAQYDDWIESYSQYNETGQFVIFHQKFKFSY